MQRFLGVLLSVAVLSGCGAQSLSGVSSARRAQPLAAKSVESTLRQNVVSGFTQIFNTYDAAPRDGRLSFGEFSHVVMREWFDDHDTNHDGAILLDEWLTPQELQGQISAILGTGKYLVGKADKSGDAKLSIDEYLGYDSFTVDATPWLNGPADADIKANGFKKHAGASGLLGAESAALMLGDLLAQGYYLDDASEEGRAKLKRSSRWPLAFVRAPRATR